LKSMAAAVLLAILTLTLCLPLAQIRPAAAQTSPAWVLGSSTNCYGYAGSGTAFSSLGASFNSSFLVSAIAVGDGYYLVGLTENAADWGMYQPPISAEHLWLYNGASWTGLGVLADQITTISYLNGQFVIGGYYLSSYPGSYGYGRVFTYNPTTSTLTEVTSTVLGGNFGDEITGACTCGSYITFGMLDSTSAYTYLDTWNGVTLTQLVQLPGTSCPATALCYNGQYTLVSSDVWPYYYEVYSNGTCINIGGNGFNTGGGTGYPNDQQDIESIAWNGQIFILATTGWNGGTGGLLSWNGVTCSVIDHTRSYSSVGWNGVFWLVGSGTGLYEYNGGLTTVDSNVGFTISQIVPNFLIVYVTSNPLHVSFTAAGEQLTTPILIPMSSGGDVPFAVLDNFTTGAPSGYAYQFQDAVDNYIGGNQTINDPVDFDITVGTDSNLTLNYALEPLATSPPGRGGGSGPGGVVTPSPTAPIVKTTPSNTTPGPNGVWAEFWGAILTFWNSLPKWAQICVTIGLFLALVLLVFNRENKNKKKKRGKYKVK